MSGPARFEFLNQTGELTHPADWNASGQPKLWLYNLHYFDDLNAAGRAARRAWHAALITRWIAENPPGHGNGWEPYPLSLRIVNWIKWSLAGNRLEAHWLDSLAVQARYLRRRLEWHLLGNHLFANAKALIFAGLFFSGGEADEWLTTGLRILDRQLGEQILADGAHFELSPMYHAIIQEDLLDLVNLGRAYAETIAYLQIEVWTKFLRRMRAWLMGMTHPDGEITFFNDAAIGIAASPAELETYALRLGLSVCCHPQHGVTHHDASGYIRVALGPFTAFVDVAKVGPDYLPGHAHADTLSFELSLGPTRLLVNRGTSIYGNGPAREEQRSTAAHNTVQVDGKNSSAVWGGFRVAKRARPFGLEIEQATDWVRIRCSHDGYAGLRRRVIHTREWVFSPQRLTVADTLEGRYATATARLHLAPSVAVDVSHQSLLCAGGCLRYQMHGAELAVVGDSYHPHFGVSVPTQCLELTRLAPASRIDLALTVV
jgi:uncharacterized heparinase superfamily protein